MEGFKSKFLIQLVKGVVSITPIDEPTSIPKVALPASIIPKFCVVSFQQSQSYYLEKFSATSREWCVKAEEVIAPIK